MSDESQAQWNHVRAVKKAFEEQMFAIEGVTGVDISRRAEAGGEQLSIRVCVTSKTRSIEDKIPDEVEGVKIEVVERNFASKPGVDEFIGCEAARRAHW